MLRNDRHTRNIILCSGSGIDLFLDGLLSCTLPEAGGVRYGFLLNPKGRILAEMFVWCYDQEHYLLDCPSSDTETLCRELMQRNFDLGLKITVPDSLSLETTATQPNNDIGWSIPDPRNPAMGWRSILENTAPALDSSYTERRLELGIPEGAEDLPRAEALPLEYGLEAAIDFTKGCFMGQEVCTRLYRMGTSKFSVRSFHCDAEITAGAVLHSTAYPKVGTVISSYGNRGFARLHLAKYHEDHPLWIAQHRIKIQ